MRSLEQIQAEGLSVVVEQGKKTNRVRVDNRVRKGPRRKGGRPIGTKIPRKQPAQASPLVAIERYLANPIVRGLDTVQISISLPVEELVAMDAFATRVQMSRSSLIRRAVKHFEEKCKP